MLARRLGFRAGGRRAAGRPPTPISGTPYLLEINVICDETQDGPRLRATLTYPDGELRVTRSRSWPVTGSAVLREFGALAGSATSVADPLGLPLRRADPAADRPRDRHQRRRGADHLAAVPSAGRRLLPGALLRRRGVHRPERVRLRRAGRHRRTANRVLGGDAPQLRCCGPVSGPTTCRTRWRSSPRTRTASRRSSTSRRWHPAQAQDRITAITAEDRLRTFDVAVPPLARFTVIRTADIDRLIFSYHFLLLDGWSREQLLARTVRRIRGGQSAVRRRRTCPNRTPSSPTTCAGWPDRTAPNRPGGGAMPWPIWRRRPCWCPRRSAPHRPWLVRLDFFLTEEQTARLTQTARACRVTLNAVISTALALVPGVRDRQRGRGVRFHRGGTPHRHRRHRLGHRVVPQHRAAPGCGCGRTIRSPTRCGRCRTIGLRLMDHEYLGLGDIQRAAGVQERSVRQPLRIAELPGRRHLHRHGDASSGSSATTRSTPRTTR